MPVVAVTAGMPTAERLLGLRGTLTDESDLEEAVEQLLAEAGASHKLDVNAILAAARQCHLLADLRDALGLDFGAFNKALVALGGDYEPVHYEAAHTQAVRSYVDANRSELERRLRCRFIRAFRSGQPLDGYVAVRELDGIAPDPSWLDDYECPPDPVIERQAAAWLDTLGAEPPSDEPIDLPPVSELRLRNMEAVLASAKHASLVVRGWAAKTRNPLDQSWHGAGLAQHVWTLASARGIADFGLIGDDTVIRLLDECAGWPVNMVKSVDVAEVGLTSDDLARAEADGAREDNERLRRRRQIVIDGKEFSATANDLKEIGDHVLGSLTEATLLSGRREAELGALRPREGRGRERTGGGGAPYRRGAQPSQEQTQAIGYVGECIAYAWLLHHHLFKAYCSPASWKSSYREHAGEPPGDDGLGYDFEIRMKTVTYYFEVKATSGDDSQFELGSSEVGRARDAARAYNERYHVLFITHALDAERRRVHLIPNPMDDRNRDRFHFSEGMRCQFLLAN